MFALAEYTIVTGEKEPRAGDILVYSLPPREPFFSPRKEEAFWKRVGEEAAVAAAEADFPFEAVTNFLKKGRNSPGKGVFLYGTTLKEADTAQSSS